MLDPNHLKEGSFSTTYVRSSKLDERDVLYLVLGSKDLPWGSLETSKMAGFA